jgi:uncharacterized SAM-binding protein YcdF (DUF218 family)
VRIALRAVRRLLVVVLVLFVLLALVTAGRILLAGQQDDTRASDVIVVLGAAQLGGQPGPYLEPRLEHAAELYTEGVAPVVITSGGNRPGDETTEAEAGRQWLIREGIPSEDVVAVAAGDDTRGSLWATAELMRDRGWTSAVVVTDPWHSLRSQEMLQHQGIDAVSSPTRSGPSNDGAWATARYTGRETLAYLSWMWQRATT